MPRRDDHQFEEYMDDGLQAYLDNARFELLRAAKEILWHGAGTEEELRACEMVKRIFATQTPPIEEEPDIAF